MKTVFIVDIDTTIANNSHRAAGLEYECLVCLSKASGDSCSSCGSTDTKVLQSSWDNFLDKDSMRKDKPVPKAQEVLARMRFFGMEFHFITGRNESLRTITESWLCEHFSYNASREVLKMRPIGNDDTASVYKEHALKSLIMEQGLTDTTFVFFEDDPFVVRMYQKYGIVVKSPEGWEHWLPSPGYGVEPIHTR